MNEIPLYVTDDIIIGMGEVPARGVGRDMHWIMPGNRKTFNRDEAIECAKKLDALIRSNALRIKQSKSKRFV